MDQEIEESIESAPADVIADHAEAPVREPFVSQKDYRPTPYIQSNWETVGERVAERDFVPLEVNIVHTEKGEADPMFEVFDSGFLPEHELLLHGIGARKSYELEEMEEAERKAAIEAASAAAWDSKIEAARQAGYDEGRLEAQSKISEHYDKLAHQLHTVTDAIYQQWSGLAGRLERQALDLALDISKKLITTTVEAKPEYIIEVIRKALSELGAAKPVRIRVSLEDFEFLNVIGLPVELSEQELGVTYVADESVKSGCVIETDFGEVDMIIDRMWNEIKDRIYGKKV